MSKELKATEKSINRICRAMAYIKLLVKRNGIQKHKRRKGLRKYNTSFYLG
jgi:hypothetical protein